MYGTYFDGMQLLARAFVCLCDGAAKDRLG